MCVFHWQGRQNMHSRQKWASTVLGPILDPFWLFLGCLGGPKIRKSQFWEGVEKTSIFEIPFFSILADFRCPRGAQNRGIMKPFSLLFRSWGLLFLLGGHFCSFWWIFVFWDSFFYEFSWFLDFVFCKRSCIFWGKILPWIAEVLAETAKILIIFFTSTSTLVECGGLRFSEQNTNCIRGAPLLSAY